MSLYTNNSCIHYWATVFDRCTAHVHYNISLYDILFKMDDSGTAEIEHCVQIVFNLYHWHQTHCSKFMILATRRSNIVFQMHDSAIIDAKHTHQQHFSKICLWIWTSTNWTFHKTFANNMFRKYWEIWTDISSNFHNLKNMKSYIQILYFIINMFWMYEGTSKLFHPYGFLLLTSKIVNLCVSMCLTYPIRNIYVLVCCAV